MKTHPFGSNDFGDKRIAMRANFVLSSMTTAGSSVINRIYLDLAPKIAAYRMINNENLSIKAIAEAYMHSCMEEISSSNCTHVLCLQDTCEINFEAHSMRMHKNGKKPGCVSNEEAGCFFHPALAIDAKTFIPYGFTSIRMWNREEGARNSRERDYKNLPPEQKESFRWSEAIDNTRELLSGDVAVTMLSDRESDVYEVLKRGGDNVRIIVRSNQNRKIKDSDDKLHDMMHSLHSLGCYKLKIPASHGRKSRIAHMEVRFTSVELAPPPNVKSDANVRLNCVMVTECSETVPHGEKPVEWILLTNHEVNTVEQALQCVNWYKCRWFIEELFRLLKRKGFAIEDIQLENTTCLEKNILFAAYAAMLCIILKQAFDHPDYYEKVPASRYFNDDEINTARLMQRELNGNTAKQQNPFCDGSLSWMAWIIARQGCWSGYLSQSRPGYTTFKSGLDSFQNYYQMYLIMKDVYKG